MNTINTMIKMIFNPHRMIGIYKEKRFHIRDVLNITFIFILTTSMLILKLNNKLQIKHIPLFVIIMFIAFFFSVFIDGLFIYFYNKYVIKEKQTYKNCLAIILPLNVIEIFVGIVQVILLVLGIKEEIISFLYPKIFYVWGISLVLIYLKELYRYNKKHLLIIGIIFIIKYFIL